MAYHIAQVVCSSDKHHCIISMMFDDVVMTADEAQDQLLMNLLTMSVPTECKACGSQNENWLFEVSPLNLSDAAKLFTRPGPGHNHMFPFDWPGGI